MELLKKIFAFIVLALIIIIAAAGFDPALNEKIQEYGRPFFNLFNGWKKPDQQIVLGESKEDFPKLPSEQISDQIKDISAKIISPEMINEATEKVNQILGEKIAAGKELPEKGMEMAKEEIRKQLYREICGEWLKEE